VKTAIATVIFTFAAGVFPLLNAEIYLAAVATRIENAQALPIALAAGLGQMLGKLPWYFASAKSTDLPWMRKRLESGKFQASFETWRERIHGRPWFSAAIMMASSVVGFPPLLVMGAVAGALRMRLWIFASTILVGRTIQSYLILAGLAAAFHLM
jgi:membrane protein YqaA with SNARE-associated domain